MTPADRRITELIDKWLASIDLHLQYVELSDAAYARAQPWPKHDRPTRWVLEVARQKILELKSHLDNRQAMGDGKFAEALELMAFLANLVCIQHIQRFIPLADPARSDTSPTMSQTVEAPTVIRSPPARAKVVADDATREMPKLKTPPRPAPAAEPAAPVLVPQPRSQPPKAPARPAAPTAPRSAPGLARPIAPAKTPAAAAPADLRGKIIADAIRLLKWGKPWHELADLIERIADRPSAAEIRKVLRAHKSEIETKAAS